MKVLVYNPFLFIQPYSCNRSRQFIPKFIFLNETDMAEVFLNPVFTALNGRVDNLVFYTSCGRQFVRSYVKPRNPDTPAQRRNRDLFREAMKSWQALSSYDRDVFSRRAKRLGMTGHNLFISRFMGSHAGNTGIETTVDAGNRDIQALHRPSSSVHSRCHSVSGSNMCRGGEACRSLDVKCYGSAACYTAKSPPALCFHNLY